MRRKRSKIFGMVALILMGIGTALILHRVLGERLPAAGAVQMVTGFTSVAVGSMLLSRHPIAVFFYFCFVFAIAILQLPEAGLMSIDALVVLVLFLIGCLLVRALPGRRGRR
jgi:hypothetical protein